MGSAILCILSHNLKDGDEAEEPRKAETIVFLRREKGPKRLRHLCVRECVLLGCVWLVSHPCDLKGSARVRVGVGVGIHRKASLGFGSRLGVT